MEISEPDASVGKRCALQAAGGNDGKCSWAVWVDSMVLPSGNKTEIGCSATCLLL